MCFLCLPFRPPTPLSIQDFCELQPLSDVETEHAVQALQNEDASFNAHICSPFLGPLPFHPVIPSPGVKLNSATPPADIRSFTFAECRFSDIRPQSSSPAMPVLNVEPEAYNSACQQPDNHHLCPCPETPCASCDPYALAPVLSPQVPYSSYIVEPHSSYSDPPVLSPQRYTAEEPGEGVISEMHMAESLPESVSPDKVPISTPLLPLVTNTEGEKASNQESPFVFSSNICYSGFECDKQALCRSRSLPRLSATALNPKKRGRSASPGNIQSKRRRVTVESGNSCRWTEQRHISAKPDNDIIAKPEDCLLLDKASCLIMSCPNPNLSSLSNAPAVKTLGSKQTAFYVPAVQNFIQAPHQINSLCHNSTSVADQSSWPQSSAAAKNFEPLLEFDTNKSHSGFYSQDSQRSASHSTSVCIESALIPDLAKLSSSSSDSDWDSELLSRIGPTSALPLPATEQSCELDKELLQRPCTWMHDTSYESHLHTVLQPSTPSPSLCGEDMDPSAFSRTVVQIVEVQHWWLLSWSLRRTGRMINYELCKAPVKVGLWLCCCISHLKQ